MLIQQQKKIFQLLNLMNLKDVLVLNLIAINYIVNVIKTGKDVQFIVDVLIA